MQSYLKVPQKDHIEEWFKFINDTIQIARSDGIIVDFGNRKFLETNQLVLLAGVIELNFNPKYNVKFELFCYNLRLV
jgi:hypothetical protein